MKQVVYALILTGFLFSNAVYSYTKWQTTKISLRTGNCQLETNKIKITTHPFHIDVEEEAVISTYGNVYSGDPNTLEITGDFQLSPGATMRSMLLWNGNKILKAKLLDRELADTIMDSIVDKTYRDPALIRYEGNNRYSFRIYPVAITKSRKLRVLYSIPLQSNNGRLKFEIKPVFTLGAQQVPTRIPIEFASSNEIPLQYILQHGSTKKAIQYGSTYLIPFQDFHQGSSYYYYSAKSQPLMLIPDTASFVNKAYTHQLETTKAAGWYTAIFSTVPDTLQGMINEAQLSGYTLEVKIQTSENNYITNIPENSFFNIYLKSSYHWEGIIRWNVYDHNGIPVISYNQVVDPVIDFQKNSALPLLWGAKYTLVEGLGHLGGVFGFVDYKMSLLALEKDTLSAAEAALYAESGVPELLPEDIFADTGLVIPKEDIIIDITDITTEVKNVLDHLWITVKSDNKVIIQLGNLKLKNLKVEVFDLKGKLIKRYSNVKVNNRAAKLNLPSNLKGIYVMRIKSGSTQISRKLILK